MPLETHDAFTHVPGDGPVLLTCEHATQRVPEPWSWPEADERLRGTHWAFDLGAADVTRKLAARIGSEAVLSNFSRLLVDPNRQLTSSTLFRTEADGAPVALNAGLTDDEKEQRLSRLYRPYHAAMDVAVGRSSAPVILSMHSFTPLYEGTPRAMEIGVLFDTEERLAAEFGGAFHRAGFEVAYNEPWSGKGGLMYAVESHAVTHGRRAIELEMRQDLAVRPADQERIVAVLAELCLSF